MFVLEGFNGVPCLKPFAACARASAWFTLAERAAATAAGLAPLPGVPTRCGVAAPAERWGVTAGRWGVTAPAGKPGGKPGGRGPRGGVLAGEGSPLGGTCTRNPLGGTRGGEVSPAGPGGRGRKPAGGPNGED